MANYSDDELIEFLTNEGYEKDAIDKILVKLRQYDSSVFRQSLFDAIETGGFDLRSVIDEAIDGASSEEPG